MNKLEEDSLGAWNFAHGTGAGCASIVAWETTHTYLPHFPALLVFTGLMAGIIHAVHKHRQTIVSGKASNEEHQ